MDFETAVQEIRPGKYRHFKGNEYEVLYIARHSETIEPKVKRIIPGDNPGITVLVMKELY